MRHVALIISCVSLLVGCPSASPRPDLVEGARSARPPSPLVDGAFYVVIEMIEMIEIDRGHRWTDETEATGGDDAGPVKRASQESRATSVIVSKRGAAMLEVGWARSECSM